MNFHLLWTLLIAGFLGYLLGCLSPAYFLGRWLKGFDIREHGTKNAGTVNTFHVLGLFPAVITALIDVSKGLVAMVIGQAITGSLFGGFIAAAAAILGHVLPFYLGFRGGQGVATSTGLMLYFLGQFYIARTLPLLSLAFLASAVIIFAWISRQGEFVGTFVLPALFFLLLIFAPLSAPKIFLLLIIVYIFGVNLFNIWKQGLWRPANFAEKGLIGWRLYLRPLAFLLVILSFKLEKKVALTLIGVLTLFFLLPDLLRLTSGRINRFFFIQVRQIYRQKEWRKFSSITLFLLSFFLTMLLFDLNIAAPAVSFLVFGDFFSKIYGLKFGRIPLFEKTLEGSLAHLAACLMSGYLLHPFLQVALPVILLGALVATITEVLPWGVDDNLSVSLLSGSVMHVALFF
jgi:glycerol-3-phosphate acyltransferase PlsY